jgi:hypothetical protein
MRQRRYEFHRDLSHVRTLVFDNASGRWHVETTGPRLERSTILLDDFEKSEDGQHLASHLRLAVETAARDV